MLPFSVSGSLLHWGKENPRFDLRTSSHINTAPPLCDLDTSTEHFWATFFIKWGSQSCCSNQMRKWGYNSIECWTKCSILLQWMLTKCLLNESWVCISELSPSKTHQDLKANPICESSPLLLYHSRLFQFEKRITEWFVAMKGPLGPWFLSSFWGVALALDSTLGTLK